MRVKLVGTMQLIKSSPCAALAVVAIYQPEFLASAVGQLRAVAMRAVFGWLSWACMMATIIWAMKSFILYSSIYGPDEIYADFEHNSMLPIKGNFAGVKWYQQLVDELTSGDKKMRIQMHTMFMIYMTLGLAFQLTKKVRTNVIDLHRWVGRLTVTMALCFMPSLTRLVFGVSNPAAQYVELPVLAMIPFFGVRGWMQIRRKQVREHRASMIMFSACFFFPVQRLAMYAMKALHEGWWAKYTPLGPWKNWYVSKYDVAFPTALWYAFIVTFGVATYLAYVEPDDEVAKVKGAKEASETGGVKVDKEGNEWILKPKQW